MKTLTLLTSLLLVLLCGPTPAHAAQLTGDAAAWAQALPMHVPGPAGPPIDLEFGPCPGLPSAGGCAINRTIYVSVLTGYRGPYFTRFTVKHELGHVYDASNLDDQERAVLSPILGFAGKNWSDCGDPRNIDNPPGTGENSYGHCALEMFADAYATCALGLHRFFGGPTRVSVAQQWIGSYYGWNPSPRVERQVCRLIREDASPA